MIDQVKLETLLSEARQISDDIYDTLLDNSATDSGKFAFTGYKIGELDDKLSEIKDLIEPTPQ